MYSIAMLEDERFENPDENLLSVLGLQVDGESDIS